MFAISHLDHSLEATIALHRTPLLTDVFLFITSLGDARIITVVVVSLLLVLWRHKRYAYKVGLLVSLLGALGTAEILKLVVERPRPLPPIELIHEAGYSFPSMHAATSMATYGFLIYVIWRLVHPPHHRAPAIALSAVLILLIGCSRMYLGVHYLTDVIAGYAIGGFFVYMGVLATKSLSVRTGRAK